MNSIARLSASRAVFTLNARVCSHLVFLLCLASLFTLLILRPSAAMATVVIAGCGQSQPATGRFIVRALLHTVDSTKLSERAKESTLLDQLVTENPSRLIFKNAASSSQSQAKLSTTALNASGESRAVENPVITVASELSDEQLSTLQSEPDVLSIEQDCIVHLDSLPNDPVPAQYLSPRDSLNLAKAWSIKTDASNVIVAISDTGTDLKHEDLAANLWTNTNELNGRSGIDDDGNGCIDDIHGCDFGDYDGDPSPFTSTEGDHGTHVSGIIGAIGNNGTGVNGVAWKASLMSVKGFDSAGTALTSDLLKTIYYAVNNGARVINCSWGANRAPTSSEIDAFQFALASGALPVVAAGNSGVDAKSTSPAGIDGVLAVGSINSFDQVSGFSNFGSHVALYASGGDAVAAGGTRDEFIYSTIPTAHGSYGTMRGTSMAAPFVTGIAALVFSVNPLLSPNDVKTILTTTARHVSSKIPDGSTSEILIPDAEAALLLAATYTPTLISSSSSKGASNTSLARSPESLPSSAPNSSGGCALQRDQRLRSQAAANVKTKNAFVLLWILGLLMLPRVLRARETETPG